MRPGPSRIATRALRGLAVAALGTLLMGCGAATSAPSHELGRRVTGGGQSLYAPRHRDRWTATVGGFELCVHHPQVGATITSVRIIASRRARPLRAHVWDRALTPAIVAGVTPRQRRSGRFITIGSTLGGPPFWSGSGFGRATPAGTYVYDLHGMVVTQTCAQLKRADSTLGAGGVPSSTIHELLLVIDVGRSGAEVRGFDVHYRAADGRSGVLRERWDVVACGYAIRDRRMCPKGAVA